MGSLEPRLFIASFGSMDWNRVAIGVVTSIPSNDIFTSTASATKPNSAVLNPAVAFIWQQAISSLFSIACPPAHWSGLVNDKDESAGRRSAAFPALLPSLYALSSPLMTLTEQM